MTTRLGITTTKEPSPHVYTRLSGGHTETPSNLTRLSGGPTEPPSNPARLSGGPTETPSNPTRFTAGPAETPLYSSRLTRVTTENSTSSTPTTRPRSNNGLIQNTTTGKGTPINVHVRNKHGVEKEEMRHFHITTTVLILIGAGVGSCLLAIIFLTCLFCLVNRRNKTGKLTINDPNHHPPPPERRVPTRIEDANEDVEVTIRFSPHVSRNPMRATVKPIVNDDKGAASRSIYAVPDKSESGCTEVQKSNDLTGKKVPSVNRNTSQSKNMTQQDVSENQDECVSIYTVPDRSEPESSTVKLPDTESKKDPVPISTGNSESTDCVNQNTMDDKQDSDEGSDTRPDKCKYTSSDESAYYAVIESDFNSNDETKTESLAVTEPASSDTKHSADNSTTEQFGLEKHDNRDNPTINKKSVRSKSKISGARNPDPLSKKASLPELSESIENTSEQSTSIEEQNGDEVGYTSILQYWLSADSESTSRRKKTLGPSLCNLNA